MSDEEINAVGIGEKLSSVNQERVGEISIALS